jgi:hypothetical protein
VLFNAYCSFIANVHRFQLKCIFGPVPRKSERFFTSPLVACQKNLQPVFPRGLVFQIIINSQLYARHLKSTLVIPKKPSCISIFLSKVDFESRRKDWVPCQFSCCFSVGGYSLSFTFISRLV